jgi:cysteine desulfurase/selenocysteine lyase
VGQRVPEFYTERRMVEQITPYQGGGEMIKDVSFEKTTYAEHLINLKQERPILLAELH